MLPVFKWLAREGGIAERELLRTFNCGIGMIVIVAPEAAAEVMENFRISGETVVKLGRVIDHGEGERVVYDGQLDLAW